MSEYAGYPVPPCPDGCGADLVAILGPLEPSREFGPGEWASCACLCCGVGFTGIVPEPPDGYQGDGVFAPSH